MIPKIFDRLTEFDMEQESLFQYQSKRVLSRPKTRKIAVVLWAACYFIGIAFVCIFSRLLLSPIWLKIAVALAVGMSFSDFYLRFLGIKIVECYQHYAKEETRRQCLCVPSCSEYAILCFKKFELVKALVKIGKRLCITCVGDYKIDWP